jgi:hypothetical protein
MASMSASIAGQAGGVTCLDVEELNTFLRRTPYNHGGFFRPIDAARSDDFAVDRWSGDGGSAAVVVVVPRTFGGASGPRTANTLEWGWGQLVLRPIVSLTRRLRSRRKLPARSRNHGTVELRESPWFVVHLRV